ncbi:RBM18 protein, partial [Polypterus senegalus]
MLQGGMRTADVARAINCHVRTVRRPRQRYRETGRKADHPRSGRPRVITPAQDRYIRISHLRDRGDGRIRVYRRRNERYTEACTLERDRFGLMARAIPPRNVQKLAGLFREEGTDGSYFLLDEDNTWDVEAFPNVSSSVFFLSQVRILTEGLDDDDGHVDFFLLIHPSLLEHHEALMFTSQPADHVALLDEPLVISCVAYDTNLHRDAVVNWFRHQDGAQPGSDWEHIRPNNGSLFFPSLHMNDLGTYTCQASSGMTTANVTFTIYQACMSLNKDMVTFIVYDGILVLPSRLVITQGPANITVAVNDSAVLHCTVHGLPPLSLRWFKDNRPLPVSTRLTLQDGGQLLAIRNVSLVDEGFYHCEAKNAMESVMSAAAYLLPAAIDRDFIPDVSNATAEEGQSVTLKCRPPNSSSPAQITWFKNNRVLTKMPHVVIRDSGDLYFVRRNTQFSFFFFFTLAIQMTPSLKNEAHCTEGSTLVLPCPVQGFPPVSFIWHKNAEVLQESDVAYHVDDLGTLFILNVSQKHEGTYLCVAENKAIKTERTTKVSVAAQDPMCPSGEGNEDNCRDYLSLKNNTLNGRTACRFGQITTVNRHKEDSVKSLLTLDDEEKTPVPSSLMATASFEKSKNVKELMSSLPEVLKATLSTVKRNTSYQGTTPRNPMNTMQPGLVGSVSVTSALEDNAFGSTQTAPFTMQPNPTEMTFKRGASTQQLSTKENLQSPSTELLTPDNLDLNEWPKKNSSQSPMKTSDGNPRFNLIKLLEKFGKVKQFDFLFHKSGPLEGQPRGYCFVNFETKERFDQYKNDKILPISLEPSSSTEMSQTTLSVNAKIKAIEAKLKMMADNPDADYTGPSAYSYNKPTDKKRSTPYSRQSRKTKR